MEEEVRMKDGSQAIINHGFGTSSADDLLYYYDRMVRPYKPRALVLATSGFITEYVAAAASGLGVQYLMLKPCDMGTLVAHLEEIRGSRNQKPARG